MKLTMVKSEETTEPSTSHFKHYALLLGLSGVSLFSILHFGSQFVGQRAPEYFKDALPKVHQLVTTEFINNLNHPLPALLLQVLVIVICARIFGTLVQKIGQPRVVGEMLAGIVLGKSVLMLIWPQAYNLLFPGTSLPSLFALSQFGLILFMFVVGLELDFKALKSRMGGAILISHFSIVFPFLLGALLAIGLYLGYANPQTPFVAFALFIGVSMSITAFPVLARIIQEKRLGSTPLGAMTITCAAIDDVTAWGILAIVVGIARSGTAMGSIGVFLMGAAYSYAMLRIVRPYLTDKLSSPEWRAKSNSTKIAMLLLFLVGSALTTEIIGMHALFGAFMAGICIPRDLDTREMVIVRIEDVSQALLLPLFFAFTGLRTQLGLIVSPVDWLVALAIVLVAIVGKMVSSAAAARITGQPWRESWAIGALMNTRGLVELIVLNIGYDLGILPPAIFTMLVFMALITTAITGPLLNFILGKNYVEETEANPNIARKSVG